MTAARAIILGTAQDGGLPQVRCACANCVSARRNPKRARRVACLGLTAGDGRGFLVDATPDFARQAEALPSLDGILLTHAHMGHVAGLLNLGREALAPRGLPVWAGPRLLGFLEMNEPWRSLVAHGRIEPRPLSPGRAVDLAPGLSVVPVAVPHRAEWSETFAFLVRGPGRTILWAPDADRFEDAFLDEVLAEADAVFLDATFWSPAEIPGRDLSEIPHPMAKDTLTRLARRRPRAAVGLVHLNHSNPLWRLSSRESREAASLLAAAGLRPAAPTLVPAEGTTLPLGA